VPAPRAILLALALAMVVALVAPAATPASTATGPSALAAKQRKAKKKCRKGYVRKTVRKNGKKVKRCRKVRKGPGSGPGPVPQPLFEAPGRRLEGQEALPFLQRYLLNSTFTDCPEGFPNCSVEERYSHTSGGDFYYCRLTLVSGADIINGARAYEVRNAVVEADGSWTFNEMVDNYGNPSFYEWHVAADGTVTGVYQYNGVEQLGPFEYVSGARDCSY
jgi:hypothetical protein